MIQNGSEYLDLQKKQLTEGVRSDGKFIFRISTGSPNYSYYYSIYKGRTYPIDLHDKGDFYGGLNIEAAEDGIIVNSSDEKNDMLLGAYGDAVLTLDDEMKGKFIDVIQPTVIENLTEALNKK